MDGRVHGRSCRNTGIRFIDRRSGRENRAVHYLAHCLPDTVPVEFARQSRTRKGAPTLVPSEPGALVRAQILVVDLNVKEATDRLYRREINAVGSGKSYVPPKRANADRVVVETITGLEGVATVLYTSMGANIPHPTATGLADLAVSSARILSDGSDGITYLDNAMKAGVETPLTKAYAAEILRLSGGSDLGDAIARIRGVRSEAQQ